jgi:hypothetical protein
MKNSTKAANAAGVGAAGATGGTLVAITSGLAGPAANLGGYATAQIVASTLAPSLAGPALATGISIIGGPVIAGGALAIGVGAAAYGCCKVVSRLFS